MMAATTTRLNSSARTSPRWCIAALLAGASLLGGCSGLSSTVDAVSDTGSSIGSRFSTLFGGNSQAAGEPSAPQATTNSQLSCPPLSIRSGASTFTIGRPGKPAVGDDVSYQVTITRTARDCVLAQDTIGARIGVEGRIIVGPAGAPPVVDVPLRVAIVHETTNGTKAVFSKFYKISVQMPSDGSNTSYSFVAEDIDYPVPTAAQNAGYVYYIGFDPQGLRNAAPAPRTARRAKPTG